VEEIIMYTLLAVLVIAVPIALLVGMLRLVDWVQRRRYAAIARQIHLTETLHAQLGAALAPVVIKPLGRPWQVRVAAPLEAPEIVNTLLATVGDEFASRDPQRPEAFQIVLSPRETPVARASRPAAAAWQRHESTPWTHRASRRKVA